MPSFRCFTPQHTAEIFKSPWSSNYRHRVVIIDSAKQESHKPIIILLIIWMIYFINILRFDTSLSAIWSRRCCSRYFHRGSKTNTDLPRQAKQSITMAWPWVYLHLPVSRCKGLKSSRFSRASSSFIDIVESTSAAISRAYYSSAKLLIHWEAGIISLGLNRVKSGEQWYSLAADTAYCRTGEYCRTAHINSVPIEHKNTRIFTKKHSRGCLPATGISRSYHYDIY